METVEVGIERKVLLEDVNCSTGGAVGELEMES